MVSAMTTLRSHPRRAFVPCVAALVAALLVAASPALATFGQLDPTFGSNGFATQQVGACSDEGTMATALEPSGDIPFAGYACNPLTGGLQWVVGVRHADGSPNLSFAGTGYVAATPVPGATSGQAFTVIARPNGTICAGGWDNVPASGGVATIACYLADGSPDPSFGSGGVTTPMSIAPGSYSEITHLTLLPTGELEGLVLSFDANGPTGSELVRWTTAGALDQTFGAGGIAKTGVLPASTTDFGVQMAVGCNGESYVAGDAAGDTTHSLSVMAYGDAGAPDVSFGTAGAFRSLIGPNDEKARGLLVQSDCAVVYVGLSASSGYGTGRLVNGQPDPSFGAGGAVLHGIAPGNGDPTYLASLEQPDGKLVVTAHTRLSTGRYDFSITRVMPDGSPDPAFGPDSSGKIVVFESGNPASTNGLNNSFLYQPDGKMLAGGYYIDPVTGNWEMAFNRYQPYGSGNALPVVPPPTNPGQPTPLPVVGPPTNPPVNPPGPTVDPGHWLLACTTRALVLENVVQQGNHVLLTGVAQLSLVGKRVSMAFGASRKAVAYATVSKTGTFAATAPLPPARLRSGNAARYQASVGRQTSFYLKLARRMVLTSATSRSGRVTLNGRVTAPLAGAANEQKLILSRQTSCGHWTVIGTYRPTASGSFGVTTPAVSGGAVYRLTTKVRKTASNPKLFSTFTLPVAV
jgi:uncharacterized delta-60 repeat protein